MPRCGKMGSRGGGEQRGSENREAKVACKDAERLSPGRKANHEFKDTRHERPAARD